MKRRLLLTAAGAAIVVGGGWALTRPRSAIDPLLGAAMAQDVTIDTSSIQDMVLGAADAPVEVIEYASFTCPHCAAFHADQFVQLKANYIDTGKVRFIYREVYFDRFGLWASMIARCGGELRFFGISELIYAQQREWAAGGDPATIADRLRTIGKTAGLDDAMLDACMADGATAQNLVAWFEQNATRDNVESTPTLFVNGVKYSNMSYQALAEILDAKLAE
ncbi:MAG: thioredoxin domain-containing protein [Rhodobacterales bacterium]|nr:thioredoxin domain-containing protein [Rhodobacterales bacterium]NCT13314.1 thioredoxin domain-containing protein [Rhodobacterales bacterium]